MNESSNDAFGQRRKGLEDAFFKDRDQQLLGKLRRELESLEERAKLAHVSGITADNVLQQLVDSGVTAETLTAVGLIPMVEVAWCDGMVSPEESDAVLNAAAKQGIHRDSAPHDLLKQWLIERPDAHIVQAWREYVRELVHLLPKESVVEMRRNLVDRCTRVAEAAGGFLGLSTISKSEQHAIDEFAKVFDG